jgi:hypothetical protein
MKPSDWIHGALCAAIALSSLASAPAWPASDSELDYVKVAEASNGRCTAVVKRQRGLYSVLISGLEPNESFDVISTSEREELVIPVEASTTGLVIIIIAPNVKGYDSGVAHIDFESRRCRIHVSYPWRNEWQ